MKIRPTILIALLMLCALCASAAVTGNRVTHAKDDAELVAALNQLGFFQGQNHAPTAGFTYTTNGYTVTFVNTSTDNEGVPGFIQSSGWIFGDGFQDATFSPVHTYGAPGSYLVSLTVTDNGGLTNNYSTTVTLLATNTPFTNPAVNIGNVTLNEPTNGVTNAVFTVLLTGTNSVPVSMHYATTNGSGLAGVDYNATNGTLIFSPGITNLPITVGVLANVTNQSNTTFYVDLSSPTNASIATARGLGTIQNYAPAGGTGGTNYDFIAASSSRDDVSAAVNLASPGQVVKIPPGDSVWTNYITLNGVSLLGSGTNQTIIRFGISRRQSDYYSQSDPIIKVSASSPTFCKISNIKFTTNAATINEGFFSGWIQVRTTNAFLFSDNFVDIKEKTAFYGASRALVTRNVFTCRTVALEIKGGDQFGDNAWALDVPYGTTNALCIENNQFYWNGDNFGAAVDAALGDGFVFRNNFLTNCIVSNHGTESGTRERGSRFMEVYNNFCAVPFFALSFVNIRGGTGVIFSNTVTGAGGVGGMVNYRTVQRFSPWLGADEFSKWDKIVSTNAYVGTHVGANTNYAQVSGTPWTINQWKGYTIHNLSYTNGTWDINPPYYTNFVAGGQTNHDLSVVTTNNANTIWYHNTKDGFYVSATQNPNAPSASMTFSNGNSFSLSLIYPQLDQPGIGKGSLVSNSPPVVAGVAQWPNQQAEMIYAWGNSLNGTPNSPIGTDYPNILETRDYTNGIVKPGYTALPYPHPLANQ